METNETNALALLWEDQGGGAWEGRLANWPRETTVCFIHPHQGRPEMSELRSAFLPDDHEPQWGPVEELMRIAEDSFRAFAEELAPRVPRPLPTSAKVKEFLSAKCAALRESAPGYCSIRAVATFYDNAESPAVFFSAYHPTPGHSEPLDEIDAAIAWVAARTDGRSESDLVREQIANLTRRAEALEAEGK